MENDIFENLLWDLSNYRPHEVSLVDEGAIQIPFLIVKENKVDKKELTSLIEKTSLNLNAETVEKTEKAIGKEALHVLKAGMCIIKSHADKIEKAELRELLEQAQLVEKMEDMEESEKGDMMSKADHDKAMKDEYEKGYQKGYQEGKADMKSEMEKKKSVDGKLTASETVEKSLDKMDEVTKSLVAPLLAEIKKSNETIEVINKKLEAEREEKAIKHFNDEAAEYDLGIDGLGKVLKDVSTSCHSETYDKLKAILTVVKKAESFRAVGASGSEDGEGFSDANQIYNIMVEKAKEAHPALKEAEAVSKYMRTKEGKELYSQFETKRKN